MKVSSAVLCLAALFASEANAQATPGEATLSIKSSCDGLSTCECTGECGENKSWFIGGEILGDSSECKAWCQESTVCGPTANSTYACGAPDMKNYPGVTVCTAAGTCKCTSDTCQEKEVTAFTSDECEYQCKSQCTEGAGHAFTCPPESTVPPALTEESDAGETPAPESETPAPESGASAVQMTVAMAAVLIPALI